MPLNIATGTINRPNRLSDRKDKEYHLKYARWILHSINSSTHQNFVTKSIVNWAFYKGNQWIFEEDLEGFLMDETGDARNRIKFTENLIRPMVEQYVGNAVRMDFDMGAIGISEFAANRRETELSRVQFLSEEAQDAGIFEEEMRKRLPIGETTEETEEIFENLYVDDYEKAINFLIKYVMERNDFEDKKIILAKNLALDGIGILYGYELNGHHVWEIQDPRHFIFDRSAKRPDLKDAEYMGRYSHATPTSIYEHFQNITGAERQAIETYSSQKSASGQNLWRYGMQMPTDGKVPMYELYWRDIVKREYGYVLDDYGYEYFTLINDDNSKYTDKDLIIPEDEIFKKVLKGKKKRKIFVDLLRYCIFIPSEVVPTKESEDIILEYGIVPYQETNLYDPSNVEFPFKCYCWAYDNGDVLSPMDDAISPQRYINRIQSIAEASVNNSRGSGTLLDSDMIDAQGGEEEILRNMNLSKPVFVKAKGNLNNSIGSYDGTVGAGIMNLYSIVQQVRTSIQNITGVNEAMQGTAGGSRRLVGVTELDIQRGTLIQEPFYYALSRILLQAGQAIATTGKRIYADSQRRLAIIAGDKGAQKIKITENLKLEDFRVFIKRVSSEDQQKLAANQMLFTLVQSQLIDGKRFANLFNRATMDDVAKGIREHQSELIEANRIRAEQEQQGISDQAQQVAGGINLEQVVKDADSQREESAKDADLERDVEKIKQRELSKSLRT